MPKLIPTKQERVIAKAYGYDLGVKYRRRWITMLKKMLGRSTNA